MKKTLLLLTTIFLTHITSAQIHQVLYGMTAEGGTQGNGTIFYWDITNSSYTKKHDVFGGVPGGAIPVGSLCRAANGTLYGFMSQQGDHGQGVLFRFTHSSGAYTDVVSFDGGSDGGYPYGSLMLASDGKLYGMISQGGIQDGRIIKFDVPSESITGGHLFINTDGSTPFGDLIQGTDGKLYGMTSSGAQGYGNIFQYDPPNTSNNLISLFPFDFFNTGGSAHGGLVQASDGKFYGMTMSGGANSKGTLFQFDVATTTFVKKLDFDSATGGNANGSLIKATNGKLYGLTSYAGANNAGTLFEFDINSSTFTKLYDFGGTNGANPTGTLMQASDGMLYGMTSNGGTNNLGVLFQYNPTTSTYTKKMDFDGPNNGAHPAFTKFIEMSVTVTGIDENNSDNYLKIYPNPSAGIFNVSISANRLSDKIEVVNLLGDIVFQSGLVSNQTEINLSDLCDGIYFVKIYDGENIYQKKILIQQ